MAGDVGVKDAPPNSTGSKPEALSGIHLGRFPISLVSASSRVTDCTPVVCRTSTGGTRNVEAVGCSRRPLPDCN